MTDVAPVPAIMPEPVEGIAPDQVTRGWDPDGIVEVPPEDGAEKPARKKRRQERKDVRNAAVLEALALPGATVAGVAKDFGISETRVRQIRAKAPQIVKTMRRMDNRMAIERIEDITLRILDSVDDESIHKAPLHQRMIAAGVLIDKRQILKGEATVIVGTERRQKIDELLPALLEEAQRRGVTLDLPKAEYADVAVPVEPSAAAPEPVPAAIPEGR